jgi:O-acetylhomoserine/O-acetylserine sulfhydrylase-like pyridoxal-dependent enzyme
MVVEFLENTPLVSWVPATPGLKNDPAHAVAAQYLKKGFGGTGGLRHQRRLRLLPV